MNKSTLLERFILYNYHLVLGLKTTVRSVQKCFQIFVIHTKIQFDPAHYSSELDTNNTEEIITHAQYACYGRKKMSDTRKSSRGKSLF